MIKDSFCRVVDKIHVKRIKNALYITFCVLYYTSASDYKLRPCISENKAKGVCLSSLSVRGTRDAIISNPLLKPKDADSKARLTKIN